MAREELEGAVWSVVLEDADLDQAVDSLVDALLSRGPSPFAAAATSHFTNDGEVATWLRHVIATARADAAPPMVYVELNGFDINPDRWFVDAFPLRDVAVSDGELRWQAYEELPVSVPSLTLTGMEEMQAAFEWHGELDHVDPALEGQARIATLLVHARLLQLFRDAVRPVPEEFGNTEIAVTAHEMGPIARFRSGLMVREADERPVLGSEDRRQPTIRPIRDSYYFVTPLGGDVRVHPMAMAATDESWTAVSKLVKAVKSVSDEDRDSLEVEPTRPQLILSQPIPEDVLLTDVGGCHVVSAALRDLLLEHDSRLPHAPVDVVDPTTSTTYVYSVMAIPPVIRTLHVGPAVWKPTGKGPWTVLESDARRFPVASTTGFSMVFAFLAGHIVAEGLRRDCLSGTSVREALLTAPGGPGLEVEGLEERVREIQDELDHGQAVTAIVLAGTFAGSVLELVRDQLELPIETQRWWKMTNAILRAVRDGMGPTGSQKTWFCLEVEELHRRLYWLHRTHRSDGALPDEAPYAELDELLESIVNQALRLVPFVTRERG